MSEPAIKVENLSKRYRIGARENNKTFREAIVDLAAEPFRRLKRFGRSSHREEDSIWALKDVSFEVQPGEVLGIIGANGTGKSTLLKILSRITEPTEGRAMINGRVARRTEAPLCGKALPVTGGAISPGPQGRFSTITVATCWSGSAMSRTGTGTES